MTFRTDVALGQQLIDLKSAPGGKNVLDLDPRIGALNVVAHLVQFYLQGTYNACF